MTSRVPTKVTFAARGFTLVEVLVSLVVLLLLVGLLGQIINYANLAFLSSSKQIECASQARAAFDRLASNLNARVETGGATIIVNKVTGSGGTGADDSLCFLAYSRTSNQITTSPQSGQPSTPRIGVFGFAEQLQKDPYLNNTSVPMLTWGNGVVAWGAQTSTANYVDSNALTALTRAASDLPTSYQNGANTTDMLEWVPLGTGIVRFEISFLLDNGTVVAVPPINNNSTYANLSVPSYALALSSSTSSTSNSNSSLNNHYVTALIVGIAVLDAQTRQLLLANNGFQTLNGDLSDVSNSTGYQTPLQVWNPLPAQWLTANTFTKPILQAVRFYQRTFFL